jgi:hypothetical protein
MELLHSAAGAAIPPLRKRRAIYNRSATDRRRFAIGGRQSRSITPFGDEEEPLGQPNATG